MGNWFSFLWLFSTTCNLREHRLDFAAWRAESLKGLEHLLPEPHQITSTDKGLSKNPVLFNLLASASQVKNSFKEEGGHLHSTQHKLFYIRIPKAASTSISSQMLALINPKTKHELLSPTQLNFITDAWLKTEINEVNQHIGFTVVRNPLERLVSVYKDIFLNTDEKPFIYQNYLGGILPKNLSFDEFVNRISRIPDRLKDQHFKPQHLFVRPYLKKGIDVKIFKLEKPELIMEFMAGYGMDFPHINKSSSTDYMDLYSTKTLKIVQNMYVHDFKLYDYEHTS